MKYIYYALLVTGLCILLLRREKLDKRLYFFIPLLFFIIVTELISDWKGAYFVYHINQAIGFTLLCAYYSSIFTRRRMWVWGSLLIYLVYFTEFFIKAPDRFFSYDPIDFVAEGVFITMFSLYYLVELYRSSGQVRFAQQPHFWIVSGNLLFYSGSALFMGFAFRLRAYRPDLYVELGYIVQVLNLVLYSIYIKAFLCRREEKILN